jgi:hypothetical protein
MTAAQAIAIFSSGSFDSNGAGPSIDFFDRKRQYFSLAK